MKKLFAYLVISLLFAHPTSHAEPTNKVVATVGSVCITALDVSHRMNFIALMSGMALTESNTHQIRKEALKMLIQEQLQLQEMLTNGLQLQDDVVNSRLAFLAQNMNLKPDNLESFLTSKTIPIETVRQFLTVQEYWPKFIRFKYPATTQVSEDRVELMFKEQAAQKKEPRYLLAEIFLPVNTPAQEASVREQVKMIHGELLKGTPFPMLAQQFSQAPSAQQAGNMGWVNLKFIPETAHAAIKQLTQGQATSPIRLDDGFVIYGLIDKRMPGESNLKDTIFSVRQLIMNLDALQETAVTTELKKCKNCDELERTLANHPYIQIEKSDHLVLQQMGPQLSEVVAKLSDNTLSDAIRYPQGTMFLWVCGRKVMDGTVSKDEIQYRLMLQNISQKSRSVLSRISRSTYVDIKDPTYQ